MPLLACVLGCFSSVEWIWRSGNLDLRRVVLSRQGRRNDFAHPKRESVQKKHFALWFANFDVEQDIFGIIFLNLNLKIGTHRVEFFSGHKLVPLSRRPGCMILLQQMVKAIFGLSLGRFFSPGFLGSNFLLHLFQRFPYFLRRVSMPRRMHFGWRPKWLNVNFILGLSRNSWIVSACPDTRPALDRGTKWLRGSSQPGNLEKVASIAISISPGRGPTFPFVARFTIRDSIPLYWPTATMKFKSSIDNLAMQGSFPPHWIFIQAYSER